MSSAQYSSLRQYLSSYLAATGTPSAQRINAREKLTKLTKHQFSELSTDVYDELTRRLKNDPHTPFLPLRDDYHPKRNQARQKLATLPTNRFKDLASDVYFELERRDDYLIEEYLSKYGHDGTIAANPANRPSGTGSVSNTSLSQPAARSVPNSGAFSSVSNSQRDLSSRSNISNQPLSSAELEASLREMTDIVSANGNHAVRDGFSRLKSDVYSAINGQDKLIAQLEDELKRANSMVSELNEKIAEGRRGEGNALEEIESAYKKLKEDYDFLQEDYTNQQNIANDIRSEATSLLSEIKNISLRNDELMQENKRLRAESASNPTGPGESSAYSDTGGTPTASVVGVIDQASITAYQHAVDELLQAARSDTPTNVLVAMKSIVITCKNITEDTEYFEASPEYDLDQTATEKLGSYKQALSTNLSNLMNVSKSHATSYGNNPVSLVEGAATNLTAVIVDLVELLQLRDSEGAAESPRAASSPSRPTDSAYPGQPSSPTGQEPHSLNDLKNFLETYTDEIVQAIQALLQSMRQTTNFGAEFGQTIDSITGIVDGVMRSSYRTVEKPFCAGFRGRAEEILGDLGHANEGLIELGKTLIDSPGSKSLKQKVASNSYEIAKHVKELINIVEAESEK
ncbi:MAG: hypothetical protein SGCHY_003132 [Lobulomycetales sp.]